MQKVLWRWLCGLVGAFIALPAVAQNFPEKPITLIVPWSAGGGTDVAMRSLAEVTAKHLGQRVVIENRAGASGTHRPVINGKKCAAGRLHRLADADHGIPPAAHDQNGIRSDD